MTGDDTKHLPLEDLHTTAGARFDALKPWLTGEAAHGEQAEAARAHGCNA